jgi:MoaA/NifB/PqqE/SkfB family radical SAM enzyme
MGVVRRFSLLARAFWASEHKASSIARVVAQKRWGHPLEIVDTRHGWAFAIVDAKTAEEALRLCNPDAAERSLIKWAEHCSEWNFLEAARAAQNWISAPSSRAAVAVVERDGQVLLRATLGHDADFLVDNRKVEIAAALGDHAARHGGGSAIKGETMAAGAVQWLCRQGRLDEAHKFLADILGNGQSGFLSMLLDAVVLKQHGPIPPYVDQLLGAEGNYFQGKFCHKPFGDFEVTPNGNVYVCCPSYLPMPVGNVKYGGPDDIINSHMAVRVRKTMLDGSFGYCNWLKCNVIKNDALPSLEAARRDPEHAQHISRGDGRISGPKDLRLSYDSTCNLWCPSCRTEKIAAKGAEFDEIMRVTDEVVRPLLATAQTVMMNGYGDIFSARSCRRILESISPQTHPRLKLRFITNGVLLTEAEWQKFPNIHRMVDSIRVSVDAVRAETYAIVRRGGDFDKLRNNLAFMARLRRESVIREFMISFVVQRENFREMAEFCRLGIELGCDFIIFEVIQNWNTFGDKFADQAVHVPGHPLHDDFRAEVEKVKAFGRDPSGRWNISSDFDFAVH